MVALPSESLLVFSDVHLGSDLNDGGRSVPRSVAIDRDLAEMLAHYKRHPAPEGRWRLVVAGDFVDFVGMSIDPRPGDELTTPLTEAERAFGLGGAEDHVRLKLKRAVERHPDVFTELAGFVAAGNAVTFISGNHDLEMHWKSVQEDFLRVLGDPEEIRARIEFQPWFFHREGLAFVEHGNQYDPFCATPYLFAPLSPLHPDRVLPSLSDTLLRYIVRRTPGLKEYGHENRGLASYISWGLMLGARGTVGLFVRFWRAVFSLRAVAFAYESEKGAQVRDEHERRLAELAAREGIAIERLRRALALHVAPIGRTPRGVWASVMLDRLGVFCAMLVALGAVPLFRSRLDGHALHVVVALLAVWIVLHVRLSRGRPSVDPAELMAVRAGDLAELFPASFVVMGHTHVPTSKALGDAIYVNLGSWAEEEPDPNETNAYRAARTFLVVHAKSDRHEAHLYEWRAGEGPRERSAMIRPVRNEEPEAQRVAS